MQTINHKALPSETILDKKYEIIRELGSGGFGITYLANFIKLDTKVVIKEYFPNDLAHRETNSTIIPSKSDEAEFYEKGKERFLLEAKTIAKFKHPYIVRIIDYFEENNTAYFVMEYEDGNSLEEWLQTHKNLTEDDILPIIIPILDALTEIHTQHIYHRDIKPDNIIMRKDGVPLLIDFGAAKESDQQGSKASSFNPRTASYAAPEQKASISKYIGAHTDLYAIGALLHKVVTGKTPPTADDRSISRDNEDKDLYESLADKTIKGFSKEFLKNIDWCLQFKGKDRPQSAKELQKALMQKPEVTPEKKEEKPKEKKEQKKEPQKAEKRKVLNQEERDKEYKKIGYFALGGIVAFIAIVGIVFYQVQASNEQEVQKKAQELRILQDKLKEKEKARKVEEAKQLALKQKQEAKKVKERANKFWNSNDIYVDKKNFLIWQDRIETSKGSWKFANTFCALQSFAKSNDWRLATENELSRLYNNKDRLQNLDKNKRYWTSSNSEKFPSQLLSVDFSNGTVYRSSESNSNYVICVMDMPISEMSRADLQLYMNDKSIYFDKNSYKPELSELKKIGEVLKVFKNSNRSFFIKLEGNGSSFGNDEDNFAMGLRRANYVKKVLISAYGINSSKIVTVSYGKSNPICTEHTENCQKKNRRVDFKILSQR